MNVVSSARPTIVTVLAVLQLIGAAAWLVIALAMLAGLGLAEGSPAVLAAVLIGQAALQVVCGIGLWQLRPYGRRLQVLFAIIGLVAFPVGTIVSVLILYYLFRPGIKLLFSGRAARELTSEESAQVAAVSGGSTSTALVIVGIGVAFVLIGLVVVRIALPALLRARIAANEASAVASLRGINTGQMAFSSLCGGGFFAPSLSSLATPPPGAPDPFIAGELATDPAVRSGYRITLVPGDPAPGAPPACNGSSVVSAYFVSAEPQGAGVTGRLFFATNAEGTIYQAPAPIRVTHSGAPPDAAPLAR